MTATLPSSTVSAASRPPVNAVSSARSAAGTVLLSSAHPYPRHVRMAPWFKVQGERGSASALFFEMQQKPADVRVSHTRRLPVGPDEEAAYVAGASAPGGIEHVVQRFREPAMGRRYRSQFHGQRSSHQLFSLPGGPLKAVI